MNTVIRIPRSLFNEVRKDLLRPHQFAYERVGFLSGKSVGVDGSSVVILNKYLHVEDENYVSDKVVGARINSTSIRNALQHSMDADASVFHVHEHWGTDIPWFSSVDLLSLSSLIPSFAGANPHQAHGGIVINQIRASGLVWRSEIGKMEKVRVSIVGFPSRVCLPPRGELYA